MNRSRRWGPALGGVLGLLVFVFARAAGAGEALPEFGNSVEFSDPASGLHLAPLRGKAALIIFFQSWCPICNGWSPKLIKQVEAAHGDDRRLVLIAIKTDGGGIADAKNYLKSKGADLDKWAVGADKDARYYNQVTRQNGLWRYVLVGADGTVAESGPAGVFWKQQDGSMGGFTLASPNLLAKCGALAPVLPADKKYPPSLAPITRQAERGDFTRALRLCSAAGPAKDREARAELKKDIQTAVVARIKTAAETLKDETKDWGTRYEAYKALALLLADFGATDIGREVMPLGKEMSRNENIQKEKAAETYYFQALAQLPFEASDADKTRVARDLAAIARKFENTRFGKLAEDEAKRIAEKK